MSELAAAYYAEVAVAHGLTPVAVPSILDGTPIPLTDPEEFLSITRPQQDVVEKVTRRYCKTLLSLSSFLIACTFDKVTDEPLQTTPMSRRHVNNVAKDYLIPHYLVTGRLTDIQIQAISPAEISSTALRSVVGKAGHTREEADEAVSRSVLLVTSANALPKSQASEGYTAFFSIARAYDGQLGPSLTCSSRQFTRSELKRQKDQWRPVTKSN